MFSQLINKIFSVTPTNSSIKLKLAVIFLIITLMYIFSLLQNVWITTDPDYYHSNITVPFYDQVILVPFLASLIEFESDTAFYIRLSIGITLMLVSGVYISKHSN